MLIQKLKFSFRCPNIILALTIILFCSCQSNDETIGFEKIDNMLSPERENKFGLVSFGNYSVYISSGNKTVKEIAGKIGIPFTILSDYNGMSFFFKPEKGTILALPIDYNYRLELKDNFNVEETKELLDELDGTNLNLKNTRNYLIHIVKKDETIFKIARIYKLSVKSIAERNNLSSDFQISTDQRLKIPIYLTDTKEPNGKLSALVDFKEESIIQTPRRPERNFTEYSIKNESKIYTEEKDLTKELDFIPPIIGQIIKKFNISSSGIRNEGVDIRANRNSPIYAAMKGTIMLVSKSAGEKLNVVIIRHEANLLSIYAGLQDPNIKKGDLVEKGSKLGVVNDINNTLHFELRQGNTPINPESYIN